MGSNSEEWRGEPRLLDGPQGMLLCRGAAALLQTLGGLDRSRWMAGAPDPSGKGTIPALTPDKLSWSATDIAYYLESGFTPEFDSAGGHMAAVVENTSRLPAEDRAAIAAYVKALPVPVAASTGY